MRDVAPSGVVARRTFTVHARPQETTGWLSASGLNGGRSGPAFVAEVEGVARTLASLVLDLPADAVAMVVGVLGAAGPHWLHPDPAVVTGAQGDHLGIRPGRGCREVR